MNKRVYIVALGFLLLVICIGSVEQVIISERYKVAETATAGMATYQLQLTGQARAIVACDEISDALSLTYVCGGWLDFRTLTSSPTYPGQPTLTDRQATATSVRRTEIALDRVLTACATLRHSTIKDIDPCPTFWTAVARSSATGVTRTPAD
jgi:hypothetical protein